MQAIVHGSFNVEANIENVREHVEINVVVPTFAEIENFPTHVSSKITKTFGRKNYVVLELELFVQLKEISRRFECSGEFHRVVKRFLTFHRVFNVFNQDKEHPETSIADTITPFFVEV